MSMMTEKVKVSKELASIIGVNEESRSQITKKIWEYIKANKLQDASAKSYIIPDTKLAAILGTARLHMMELPKKINVHIVK